jgi:hypothetical protein
LPDVTAIDDDLDAPPTDAPATDATRPARMRPVRRFFMRPRRVVVKVHRWTSIVLFAWLVVVSLTGAWLVFHHVFEGWLNPGRYDTTPGDVGPQAAVDTAVAAAGDDAELTYLTLPNNGRGVYQVFVEVPIAGAPAPAEGEEAPHEHFVYFVDPGGAITDRASETEGVSGGSTGATCTCGRTGDRSARSIRRPAGAGRTPTAPNQVG